MVTGQDFSRVWDAWILGKGCLSNIVIIVSFLQFHSRVLVRRLRINMSLFYWGLRVRQALNPKTCRGCELQEHGGMRSTGKMVPHREERSASL